MYVYESLNQFFSKNKKIMYFHVSNSNIPFFKILRAMLASAEVYCCILPLDKTLLNLTNIAMGLRPLWVLFDPTKGSCLVVADVILSVFHHIAMIKS